MLLEDDLRRVGGPLEVRAVGLPVGVASEADSRSCRLVDADGSEFVILMPLNDAFSGRRKNTNNIITTTMNDENKTTTKMGKKIRRT